MSYSIAITNKKELERWIKSAEKKKIEEIKKEVIFAAVETQYQAKRNLKESRTWDLGHLASRIQWRTDKSGYIGITEAQAPYSIYVEKGTRPHFPPPDALEGWARRRGMESAWPICKAIAKRGLKARPFLFPAFLTVKKYFLSRMMEIFK